MIAGTFLSLLVLLVDVKSVSIRNPHTVIWTGSNRTSFAPENSRDLIILCFESHYQPSIWTKAQSVWTTARFSVLVHGGGTNGYTLYEGPDPQSIITQRDSESSISLSSFIKPWLTYSGVSIDPFNKTCIGIADCSELYTVELKINDVDYWRLACTLAGLVLFFSAPKLSGSIVCYYSAGVGFGVLASALIIIFILSKFIPRKTGAVLFLTAGYSFAAYILHTVWEQSTHLLQEHRLYLCAYFVVAGLISFAVCYYKGPVTNPRLLTLIQWTLQLVAIGLIYAGCQITEVSITIIILCVARHNLAHVSLTCGLWQRLVACWRRLFPPRIRLLTEQEYQDQGRIETEKALAQLKSYCNSPECNAWSTMSRLKSPDRFALWASGCSLHITDDEIIEHDLDPSPRPHLDLDNSSFDPDDMGEEFVDHRLSQSMVLPSNSRYVSPSNSRYAPSSSSRYTSPSNSCHAMSHYVTTTTTSHLANRSMDSVRSYRGNSTTEYQQQIYSRRR